MSSRMVVLLQHIDTVRASQRRSIIHEIPTMHHLLGGGGGGGVCCHSTVAEQMAPATPYLTKLVMFTLPHMKLLKQGQKYNYVADYINLFKQHSHSTVSFSHFSFFL